MPKTTVTTPDGDKVTVNHPEGASDAEIISFAKQEKERTDPELSALLPEFAGGRNRLLGSAGDELSEFASMIANPIDTARGAFTALSGGMQKGLNAVGAEGFVDTWNELPLGTDESDVGTFETMTGMLDDRYGFSDLAEGDTEEAWKKTRATMINEPFGVLGDISGVVTGGAGTGRLLARGSRNPDVTPQGRVEAGFEKVGKLASSIDPLNLAANAAVSTAKLLPDAAARKLYLSASKPSTSMSRRERDDLVDTAMREEILPDGGGVDKINDIVRKEMETVDRIIDEATHAGDGKGWRAGIRADDILAAARKYRDSINPETFGPDYQKVIDEIDGVIARQGELWGDTNVLSPNDVQAFKRNLDPRIDWLKDKEFSPGEESALVALRGEAKGRLEKISPEIKPANARAGKLLNLRERLISRAENRIENKDFIGLGPMATVLPAQALLGSVPGGIVGVGADIARRKTGQGAIALRKLKESSMRELFTNNGDLTTAGRELLLEIEELNEEEER